MTDIAQRPTSQPMAPNDPELVVRVGRLVEAGRTELAPSTLRVPLEYYRDPEQLAKERALLLSTPLALVESARVPNPIAFVVRDVLGTSVIVTRNSNGEARALVNYCRHRGARTADGCGSARR